MSQTIFPILNKLLIAFSVVTVLLLGIFSTETSSRYSANAVNLSPSQMVAYDINKQIDQERKEAVEKRYGEQAGEVVEKDALSNNQKTSNSDLKIKREDSLPQKAEKVINQVKDKGLVDKKTRS